jgi:methionine synthase II (cobalamin-independent)
VTDIAPIISTGIGSWPGTDMMEALKITFAECPEFPYLPELPARGSFAQLIGRSTAFLAGLAVDLQPAGWRLTDASGRDHRLAKATLRADLDQLEEVAQGYGGRFKFSVAGPWTLAAMMERPRGDRVLADHGARRDLAQSLSEGIADLVNQMRRRLPDIEPVIQIDEPMLPAVVSGAVPTASGFSRHRAVDLPRISDALSPLVAQLDALSVAHEVPVVVHCCAAGLPIELLRRSGVRGVAVDLDQLSTRDWDAIGAGMEQGLWLGAGAHPSDPSAAALTADQVAAKVVRPIRTLGLDPAIASQLVITPACGLAGADPVAAVRTLRTIRTAADIVTNQLAE